MIAKCSSCHHEWQASKTPGNCGWCGAPGYKLANDYLEYEQLYDLAAMARRIAKQLGRR